MGKHSDKKVHMSPGKYVKNGGGVCPCCGSTQFEGGSLEVIDSSVYQEVDCLDCGASWNDVYKLSSYELLEGAESGE